MGCSGSFRAIVGIQYQVFLTLSVRRYLKLIGGGIADNKHEQLV